MLDWVCMDKYTGQSAEMLLTLSKSERVLTGWGCQNVNVSQPLSIRVATCQLSHTSTMGDNCLTIEFEQSRQGGIKSLAKPLDIPYYLIFIANDCYKQIWN